MSNNSKPSRAPLVLSGCVFPGSGQFMQRRWVSGVIFSCSFTVCLVFFMVHVIGILVACFKLASEFNTIDQADVNSPIAEVGLFFVLSLVVWGVGFYDTWKAHGVACTRWSEQKLADAARRVAEGDEKVI